jgi:hypothetical protein
LVSNTGRKGNIPEQERASDIFHRKNEPDALAMWTRGLTLYLDSLDDLGDQENVANVRLVQIACLIRAWNTLYCARDLACRGYYPQALNLLRTPIEDWLAFWYVNSFPKKARLFLDHGPKITTPRFHDMLEQLKNKHGDIDDSLVKKWLDDLNSFSHVDKIGIGMVLESTDSRFRVGLGPQTHRIIFRLTAIQAVRTLVPLIEAVENFRLQFGLGRIENRQIYQDEARQWLDEMEQSLEPK